MQLPQVSKESLLNFAAYLSLFLTAGRVLWPDMAHLIAAIWRSFVEAVESIESFRNRHKLRG